MLGSSDEGEFEESEDEEDNVKATVEDIADAVVDGTFGLCTECGKEVDQAGAWCCEVSAQKWAWPLNNYSTASTSKVGMQSSGA
jgi:hypothetical protein